MGVLDRQASKTQIFLDKKIDEHGNNIKKALEDLEIQITSLLAGKKTLTTSEAIALRPQIKNIIERTYLVIVDKNIRDYDSIVKRIIDDYGVYKRPKNIKITVLNASIIAKLKKNYFNQLKEIGATTQELVAQEIYNSALIQRPFDEMLKQIKQNINGIYSKTSEKKINALVAIADKAPDSKRGKAALKKLQSLYGADRTGVNLRRYATQITHDSVMNFHSQVNIAKAVEIGLNKFRYTGTLIATSRDFCRRRLGKVYTEKEIRKIWSATGWTGKSPGDPFVVRGGYNCRHHWQPIADSFLDKKGELII